MPNAALDRLGSALAEALVATARAAAANADPWWIIGSAALALHGIDPAGVDDVDLLTSARDARALLEQRGGSTDSGGESELFRSAVYGRWCAGDYRIEVMGDLHVATAAGWKRLQPMTRERIMLGEVPLYVPARSELRTILECFGRPKDLRRAALLR